MGVSNFLIYDRSNSSSFEHCAEYLCRNSSHVQLWMWTLQWRHNGNDNVSNHQPHDCLLSRLFRRISKKTSKLRVTGLCAGKRPVTRKCLHLMTSSWPALISPVLSVSLYLIVFYPYDIAWYKCSHKLSSWSRHDTGTFFHIAFHSFRTNSRASSKIRRIAAHLASP